MNLFMLSIYLNRLYPSRRKTSKVKDCNESWWSREVSDQVSIPVNLNFTLPEAAVGLPLHKTWDFLKRAMGDE